MNETDQRRMAVLKETAAFYGANPEARALNEDEQCRYLTDKGLKCAVGRLLPDGHALLTPERDEDLESIFRQLPDSLQELGCPFLRCLQYFHDTPKYWDENGLTEEGEEVLCIFKEEIAEGTFDIDNGSSDLPEALSVLAY